MFYNNKKARKITGMVVRILFMSALVIGAIQRAEAAVWTTIKGHILTQTGEPVCAMVLANGQDMFSCDGNGTYDLLVPLDSSGNITLQVFATGFASFRQTLTAGQAENIYDVSMDRDTTGRDFTITHFVSPPLPNGWVTVSGTIHKDGTPLCAMILINGQSMFSCNQNLGQYSLEVPRDSNGKITLQAFATGFMPHRDTFGVNDPPIATGQCDTTFQADTYSGVLNATDPELQQLTYALIDPSDGTSAGNGPIPTPKGGAIEITNPTTGDYIYTPDTTAGDKRGRDSFQYQVTDTGGLSDIATEVVIVNQTVMPLGDSVTVGDTDAPTSTSTTVGYRWPLYDALIKSNFLVDLVGTKAHGTDTTAFPGFDFNHEGHGGWTASEIAWGQTGFPTDGVRAWLNSNPADIILLHAGTNGLDPSGDIDIEVILDEIDLWESSAGGNPVTVILALIIDQVPLNPDVTAFNNNVSIMASDRINNGYDIIIVDQQNGAGIVYTIGVDMAEELHPNASGYEKMKNVWIDALANVNPNTNEAVLDKCP
jgi:hypothetical protein